ncbi:potassium transporter Trk [Virgibacillus profundi]|uniref:Potassium transporter Trk n=1 Tax=Virgibacillus profundi TaxID=2024555 RepID=A0A2A2IC34_9BACI|nr:TrkA family potassium uptake protein [Virgibacillus profundi]PAV29132.1 potassium transporter Trk [Virgibacillus profundi]PXY53301.1 TrkA family potassium uptake protein [Virgibacillus profundi]
MKKEFAVIGLGTFGSSVCKELYNLGNEVLAIDMDEENVREVMNNSSYATVVNATDQESLESLGIQNFDYAVVSIGENIQQSILCTLILKEMGVKNVWVKAKNEKHHKILEKIGADRIIHPEQEIGIRVANQLDSGKITDYIELSKDYSIIEVVATKRMSNHSLVNLDIRAKFGCTILAIKREENVNISPLPDDTILKGDILVVMGHIKDLKRFEDKGV